MTTKKELGQFFTTNSEKILQGFEDTVKGKIVMDPFAGGGDLLKWAEMHGAIHVSGLDIDPSLVGNNIKLNDSLVAIPHASFIITNPPWLASNKMRKSQKDKYPMDQYEDLYLLSMKRVLESDPDEGIAILPVNFFSAENSDALRKEFLVNFIIDRVNYFKEQVFEDTTYNTVAFHYTKKTVPSTNQTIEIHSFPGGDKKEYFLEEEFEYRIAGRELYKFLSAPKLKVIRLTEDHMAKNSGNRKVSALFNDKNTTKNYTVSSRFKKVIQGNIIVLNCIDTNGSKDGWINAQDIRELNYDCLVGKNTSRNIAYVLLTDVSLKDQEKIITTFNQRFNSLRRKYNSLFLTNFRDNDRKRVSFEFCYKLIAYCYEQVRTKTLSNKAA
jgi:hypothetical protein